MIGIIGILTIITPILSIMISLLLLLIDKKHRFFYSICLSISLASLAYLYISPNYDDLYRHHLDVVAYRNIGFKELCNTLFLSIEKIPIIIEYVVCKIGKTNLLQFIVTFFSYFNILYVINRKTNKTNSILQYGLILIFTLVSFSYLTIISNLWFILAASLFCVGIIKQYDDNKKICYLYYVLAIFTHSSMIFPLLMLLLFRFLKYKISLKTILMLIIIFISMKGMVMFLHNTFNNNFTLELYNYYLPYFENTEFIQDLHPFKLMVIYLIKLIPYILIFLLYKNMKNEKINKISIYFALIVLIMYCFSSFSVRFIPIVQLLGIGMLTELFNKQKSAKKIIVIFLVIIISFVWIGYNYWQIKNMSFYNLNNNIYKNIISIIESR